MANLKNQLRLFLNRRTLLLAAFFAAASAATTRAQQGQARRPTVLFVCQYGAVKSAVARDAFRRRAMERGISLRAISRGITPADHMSDPLRRRLRSEGLDPARDPVTQLDQETLNAADIVIVFDRLPSSLTRADARDWSQMPSMNSDYDRARAFLDPRIEALLDEIANRH